MPKTIPLMVLGTKVLEYWVLGHSDSGLGTETDWLWADTLYLGAWNFLGQAQHELGSLLSYSLINRIRAWAALKCMLGGIVGLCTARHYDEAHSYPAHLRRKFMVVKTLTFTAWAATCHRASSCMRCGQYSQYFGAYVHTINLHGACGPPANLF